MRIGIDARYLKSDFSGIGTYSANLLRALSEADEDNEYVVVVHDSFDRTLELGDNFRVIEDHARPVSMRSLFGMHRVFEREQADLLHVLWPLAPLAWKRPLVVTVHDLQPLLDPNFTGGRSRLRRFAYDQFYWWSYPAVFRRANYLISDSFYTKECLLRLFPKLSGKVLAVPGGVDEESFVLPDDEQIRRVREKYELPETYLLYLGSTRPNKNLMRMVEAFDVFRQTHPEHADLRWVMVLNKDRFFDQVFAEIRRRELLSHIRIVEQVTPTERRVLYREAAGLYFCTMFEGFGLPVLEAQAQGVPVLAAAHGAIPEVAGSHTLLCQPERIESIVEGLGGLMKSAGHADSESLRQHARRFTWRRTAKEILDAYGLLRQGALV